MCIAFSPDDNDMPDGQIRMNKGSRKNLRVRLGDTVKVCPLPECPNLVNI